MHVSPEVVDTWQKFAEVTIKTNDLDPMYSVIAGLNKNKSREWMGRFVMYFLLFYDAGGAASVANTTDDEMFWSIVKVRAENPSTKRGTERRHFRGKNAQKAIFELWSFYMTPWELLMTMYSGNHPVFPPTYTEFYRRMTTVFSGTQFGPYFIWKLYDIFNVCLDMPIRLSFAEAVKYMPDEPRKSADHFFRGFGEGLSEVTNFIAQFDHPVVPGRKCGLAEAETILCMMKGAFKTKSHVIGDDINDKYVQLNGHPELQFLLPDRVSPVKYQLGELK